MESPYALSRSREPYLLFLPVRGDQLSSGFNLWHSLNGAYRQIKQGIHFAQRGHVLTEYPADTNVIDQAVRLEIQFDSADGDFEELSLDQALQDEVLAFAGTEILSLFDPELFKFTPTHQNGVPNTRNGPPTATTHVTGEVYRDQNGAVWRCTAGGTPGTWLQVLPAFVAADPASGTFPTGYLIVNVTTGQLKANAGGLAWKAVHLPVAGGTLDDGANLAVGTGTGTRVGTAATQKLGFWGATPVAQPSGADQAAVVLVNADGEIGGLTISDPPTQAEVQALRDACEELADDVRALSALACQPKPWRRLMHALRGALVAAGVVKGGA